MAMHNKVLLCAVSVFSVSLSLWGEEKEGKPTIFYGKLPAQIAFDLKKKQGAPVQVKFANYRLLYGASGNGVRTTAKVYAEGMGGVFEEHPFSVLLYNYKKNGPEYIASVFKEAKEREKTEKKQVFLYIPGIDFIEAPPGENAGRVLTNITKTMVNAARVIIATQSGNSGEVFNAAQDELKNKTARIDEQQKVAIRMREHKLALVDYQTVLELVLTEIEKEEYEGKVFTILSTHHRENVDKGFLGRLDCPIVTVEADIETAVNIFFAHFFAQEVLCKQSPVADLLDERVSKDCCISLRSRRDELMLLQQKYNELADFFWDRKENNDKSWFEQEDFKKVRVDIVQLSADIIQKAEGIVRLCDEELRTAGVAMPSEEKELYVAARDFHETLKLSYSSLRFFYQNYDCVIEKISRALAKNPGNRYAKQLAQKIIQTACVENGGMVTKEIFLRFMN